MGKRIDMTGEKFGEWKVIKYEGNGKWKCECSCGVTKDVNGNMLRQGKSLSCGHTSEKAFINLKDMSFGEWEVLDYVENGLWECRCSCGTKKNVHSYSLRNGKTNSCGHSTTGFKDLTGMIFGEWEVLNHVGSGRWSCKCSCGKIVEVLANSLTLEKSKSCGHATNNFKDITAMTFGELTANKYMGNEMWECLCSCGTILNVHTYALRSGNTKSCGHAKTELTLKSNLARYGESSMARRENPREEWQIKVVSSREALEKYIKVFNTKPTYTELSNKLNIGYSTLSQKVRKYELEDCINISDTASEKEKELFRLIQSMAACDIQTNTRSVIPPYELDMHMQDLNIAIEFNGTYWHNYLIKGKKYHQNKSIECAKRKIQLIHVFEYEWMNPISKEKIISLIKRRLNINTEITRIYGRSTKILEINNSEAVEFCNKYHLQNGTNSAINIGLYYKSELIGVMTFGKPRFSSKQQWEMFRLCFKNNISIVGGAEKLFKYFLSKYNPESIISYCDASKFRGEVYKKLGFIVEALTEPNYVWADSVGNTFSRYQTQKHKLLELGLGEAEDTENSIMDGIGYYKLYDSGNLRFTWSK